MCWNSHSSNHLNFSSSRQCTFTTLQHKKKKTWTGILHLYLCNDPLTPGTLLSFGLHFITTRSHTHTFPSPEAQFGVIGDCNAENKRREKRGKKLAVECERKKECEAFGNVYYCHLAVREHNGGTWLTGGSARLGGPEWERRKSHGEGSASVVSLALLLSLSLYGSLFFMLCCPAQVALN